MKLGEALTLRADLLKRISQAVARVTGNVVTQEDEEPQEDPQAVMQEWMGLIDQYEKLVFNINYTNTNSVIEKRKISVTQALAQREALTMSLKGYRQILEILNQRDIFRYSRSEIKMVKHLKGSDLQKGIDSLSQKLRELDTDIQEHNWITDLQEVEA